MKIDNISPTKPLPAGSPSPHSVKRADNAAGSSTHTHLSRPNVEPEVNMERVNELKAAISEGRLTINAEKIAKGLIESTVELLGGVK